MKRNGGLKVTEGDFVDRHGDVFGALGMAGKFSRRLGD